MPRYAALIYGPETTPETVSEAEWAATMKLYNDFGETAGAAGVLGGGEALESSANAVTVHVKGGAKGGEVVVTDGPFAETKEVLGGFYLLTEKSAWSRDVARLAIDVSGRVCCIGRNGQVGV